jgi:hypothetical protein
MAYVERGGATTKHKPNKQQREYKPKNGLKLYLYRMHVYSKPDAEQPILAYQILTDVADPMTSFRLQQYVQLLPTGAMTSGELWRYFPLNGWLGLQLSIGFACCFCGGASCRDFPQIACAVNGMPLPWTEDMPTLLWPSAPSCRRDILASSKCSDESKGGTTVGTSPSSVPSFETMLKDIMCSDPTSPGTEWRKKVFGEWITPLPIQRRCKKVVDLFVPQV